MDLFFFRIRTDRFYEMLAGVSHLRAHLGARRGECGFLHPDPPRGRPLGGGTPHSWEYGGDSPHTMDPFSKPECSVRSHPHFSGKHQVASYGL